MFVSIPLCGQEYENIGTLPAPISSARPSKTTDTLYYDKDGKASDKAFAAYMRVYSIPGNDDYRKRFRDYYMTGELQEEGDYISIDKYNDFNSVFDGECIKYGRSGNVLEKKILSKGKLSGEYTQYSDSGLLVVNAYYIDGELDGICTRFSGDGTECEQIEYDRGIPLNDLRVVSNSKGCLSKIALSTGKPILEIPSLEDRKVDHIDKNDWFYYDKNGIVVAVMKQASGNKLQLTVSNYSMFPIDLDPDRILVSIVKKKGITENREPLPLEVYMKRVKHAQNFELIMAGLVTSLEAEAAGYSVSTTKTTRRGTASRHGRATVVGPRGYASGSYSGYSSYRGDSRSTTVTYDAAAAYQAHMIANQQMATLADAALSERKALEEGYLKKGTVVYPGETISGFVVFPLGGNKNKGKFSVNVDIDGISYAFDWNVGKVGKDKGKKDKGKKDKGKK